MIFLWWCNNILSLLFVGQPYSNPDGSVYTHNPNLPLPNGQPPTSMYQTSEGWTHNSVTFYIFVLLFYGSVEANLSGSFVIFGYIWSIKANTYWMLAFIYGISWWMYKSLPICQSLKLINLWCWSLLYFPVWAWSEWDTKECFHVCLAGSRWTRGYRAVQAPVGNESESSVVTGQCGGTPWASD